MSDHQFKPKFPNAMFCERCNRDDLSHQPPVDDPPKFHDLLLNERRAKLKEDMIYAFNNPAGWSDHFHIRLFRLIAHADSANKGRLSKGFPLEVEVYDEYAFGLKEKENNG